MQDILKNLVYIRGKQMRKNLYKILLVTLIATSTVLYGCGAKNNDVNANSNKTVAESKEVSKVTYPVTV